MKNIINRLQQNYDNLSGRDKRVLIVATPVVVVLILYLLVYRPISHYHAAAIQSLESASDDYYWLRAQSPITKSGFCGRLNDAAGDKSYLRQQAKRDGLAVSVARAGSQLTIAINSANGGAVLRYANNLACNGYQIK